MAEPLSTATRRARAGRIKRTASPPHFACSSSTPAATHSRVGFPSQAKRPPSATKTSSPPDCARSSERRSIPLRRSASPPRGPCATRCWSRSARTSSQRPPFHRRQGSTRRRRFESRACRGGPSTRSRGARSTPWESSLLSPLPRKFAPSTRSAPRRRTTSSRSRKRCWVRASWLSPRQPREQSLRWCPTSAIRRSRCRSCRSARRYALHLLRLISRPSERSHRSLAASFFRLPGIGRKKLADVVEALHQFRAHSTGKDEGAHTLDRIWDLASRPLSDAQRIAVERSVGITGEPEAQGQIADDLGKSQPQVSIDVSKGLERLDLTSLADLNAALDAVLDGFGGIVRLDEIGARFEDEWPAGIVSGAGIVRLVVRVSMGRAHLFEVDGADQPLVARPIFDRETLKSFAAEVVRLAGQWPPVEPDTARRTLAVLSASLRRRSARPRCSPVRGRGNRRDRSPLHWPGGSEAQHCVRDRSDAGPHRARRLDRRVRRVFGLHTPYPDRDHLLTILRDLIAACRATWCSPGGPGRSARPRHWPRTISPNPSGR